jgi:hypothetical protein
VLVAIGAAVIGTLAAPFFLPARRVSQPAGHAPAATPNEPARAELSRTFAGVSAR